MSGDLGPLVAGIVAAANGEGSWKLASDEVARLLGLEQVEFWRAVHSVRDRISFADAIDGWDQDSAGDLVTVLEQLFGPGPEQALTRAGLLLPHEYGVRLTEELFFRARLLGAAHVVDQEELAAMLRHTGNVQSAVGMYLREHVDFAELREGCAEYFRLLHNMPPAGRVTSARYLKGLFARHILEERSLLAGLEERLRLAAAGLGYVDPDVAAGPSGAGASRGPRRHAWAARVMGLEGNGYSAEDVRVCYRKLMMRYHPDVDPSGLERCKDVNVAYALLISEFTPRG